MNKTILAAVAGAAVLGFGGSSLAATLVFTSDGVAAINDVTIDGKTYDVTFGLDASSPTFQGNPSGAQDAANALTAALNTTSAGNLAYPGGSATIFYIQDDGGAGLYVTAVEPHEWFSSPSSTSNGAVALFTRLGVPEPATWGLMGMGVFGLGAVLRSRRSNRLAA